MADVDYFQKGYNRPGPTIYFGFEWSVVPLVFVYDLGAQAAYRDAFFGRPAYGAGSQRIVRKDQMNVIIYVLA